MSKDNGLHDMSTEDDVPESNWPSWFIEPAHPVEREILLRILSNNKHLSEVHFIVNMMQINFIVFTKNYAELVRLHQEFDQPMAFREIALETEKGQVLAQNTIIEFTRLLHNYLASAKMLVDVTRRWVHQQFADSEFIVKYQEEISIRFANNVQAQFLEDLRNFTLHRTLPLSIIELRMQPVSENRLKSSLGIVLVKNFLYEWKDWSELGRLQIDMAFEGDVDILQVCKQYYDTVTEFTKWLFWQVRELFSDEIDQINAVIESIRNQ